MSSPDEVCRVYSDKNVRLKLWNDDKAVFLEGSAQSLEFLADLLRAHARQMNGDCGFQLSPSGAGNAYFDPQSAKGLYIHCLPCEETKAH